MIKPITAVDLFCGAGGTSTGAKHAARAFGRDLDLTAVNHWDRAIETHSVNHPDAKHHCCSIDMLNPADIAQPGCLDVLLASPECIFHSRARGGKPVNDQRRATAWCVCRWAERLTPSVILVENVQEFADWGPLGSDGTPLKSRKGEIFDAWVNTLKALGYKVDWRILKASDFGEAQSRERLFVQAVRGRRKIVWPEPTHGQSDLLRHLAPYRTARDIIQWSKPSRSIFDRKKPLSPNTMERIMSGWKKFGLAGGAIAPFIVAWDNQSGSGEWSVDKPLSTVMTKARHGVAEPFLVRLRGTSDCQIAGSAQSVDEPVPTVTSGGGHIALCQPFIIPQQSGGAVRSVDSPLPTITSTARGVGLAQPYLVQVCHEGSNRGVRSVDEPMPTVCGTRGEWSLIQPYLVQYYGTADAQSVDVPLPTVTTKDRFGLVQPIIKIDGETYAVDIHFRMLNPRELANAQGFPAEYQFAGNSTEAVKQIGNAVPVRLAEALIRAQLQAGNI